MCWAQADACPLVNSRAHWQKAGDTILFGQYSGQEIKLDGVDYLVMKEDDVLAIQEGRQ
jgi:chaperonin GroES